MSLVLIYMGVMADGVICTERSTFKRDPNLRRLSRKGVPLLMFAVCGLRFAVCGLRFAVCGLRFAVCASRPIIIIHLVLKRPRRVYSSN